MSFFSHHSQKKYRGFGLVEIIIAVAIVSISLFALSNASNLAFTLIDESTRETRASFLLEEGVEAVRILRDSGWSANIAPLTSGTGYYPIFATNWTLASTDPGPIDGIFTRTITLENVLRDGNDDIAPTGTPDLDTKKVTVSVSWNGPRGNTKTRSIATYITNLLEN